MSCMIPKALPNTRRGFALGAVHRRRLLLHIVGNVHLHAHRDQITKFTALGGRISLHVDKASSPDQEAQHELGHDTENIYCNYQVQYGCDQKQFRYRKAGIAQ